MNQTIFYTFLQGFGAGFLTCLVLAALAAILVVRELHNKKD